MSHRAQTILYTLLMRDRYDVDVQWGLLFYLKTGNFIRVQSRHSEIRMILIQRNGIAFHNETKLTLPPMVKNQQTCRRCFSFSSCTVLHKLLEDGTPESSGIGDIFENATNHLNVTHAEFLRKWNRLLSLEQGDVVKFQNQIWTMLSSERQGSGNCLSNMILLEEQQQIEISEKPTAPAARSTSNYHSHLQKNKITFRIDKDEMSAGIARSRNNIIQLFRKDADGGDAKRRHLVVDLERPVFHPLVNFQLQDQHLNDDQRRAVEAVLTAKDYALIIGMPGTGKTTTIAHIIHMLVAQGKSVLLSSYTQFPSLLKRRFDYCIVDEASQITLPVCLGPIRYADVFVLVGDHNQLPPLVKNPKARRDGFDLSLFKMLSDRYPDAVASLTRQYRMNEDVMLLSNTLVYGNKLQCGTKEVADKVLKIPAMDHFRQH
ncbi:Tripartite DNA replication factor [Modicella reniformis]|uniref:Tripartite DNA replication factor n=1 Tax=Modicella reniformis TaxID=1440133 RepID=A0A9P6MJ14_9FUNG|nr:Tripartite DNA replication factor [Modicella reniformis]